MTLHTIVVSLLEAGAHIDCVNSAGQTALEAATSGKIIPLLLKGVFHFEKLGHFLQKNNLIFYMRKNALKNQSPLC